MKLRELRIKDAESIYQWMSDEEIASSLLLGRYPASIENIKAYIEKSWTDRNNIHWAITNDSDDYVGTVSLKNINYLDRNAEYAIAIRKEYWGQDYSKFATDKIIEYGFKKLNLYKIYLNVLSSNARANKFYEKYGFIKDGQFSKHIYIDGQFNDLIWYCIFNS